MKEFTKNIKEKVLENLANFITFLRLFFSVWLLITVWCNPEQLIFMTILACLAILTDFLDGKIARELEKTSKFGAALDQLGDKVFVMPSLGILICKYGWVMDSLAPKLVNFVRALVTLLIFIEFLQLIAWWIFFLGRKVQAQSNNWAKAKTFSAFGVIIVWLILLIWEIELKKPVIQSGIYLIALALIVTDILAFVAVKTYYQDYIEQTKIAKDIKEKRHKRKRGDKKKKIKTQKK